LITTKHRERKTTPAALGCEDCQTSSLALPLHTPDRICGKWRSADLHYLTISAGLGITRWHCVW